VHRPSVARSAHELWASASARLRRLVKHCAPHARWSCAAFEHPSRSNSLLRPHLAPPFPHDLQNDMSDDGHEAKRLKTEEAGGEEPAAEAPPVASEPSG
jgi:hypothetical protein